MTEPVLDLDTLIVRPTVEIDGKRYEILSTDELSVLDSRRFTLWGKELNELQTGDGVSQELEELVDTIARKVLVGVPEEVLAKLAGTHKIAVVEVFTALLLRSRMSVAGAIATATGNRHLGEIFFPGSSASTAARPDSGWRKLLSRWFGLTPA